MIDLVPCDEDGFEVWYHDRLLGYVFPDAWEGWRPYTVYGRVLTAGRPAHRSPRTAAGWLLEGFV